MSFMLINLPKSWYKQHVYIFSSYDKKKEIWFGLVYDV